MSNKKIMQEIEERRKQADIDLENSKNKIREFNVEITELKYEKKQLNKEIAATEKIIKDMSQENVKLTDLRKEIVKAEVDLNIKLKEMAKVAKTVEYMTGSLPATVKVEPKKEKKEEKESQYTNLSPAAAIRTAKAMSKLEKSKVKVLNFSVRKFKKDYTKPDKYKTADDLTFPYKFNFVAFAEGEWTDSSGCSTYYPWDVVKSAEEMFKAPTVIDHDDWSALDRFGKVESTKANEGNKTVEIEGIIFDTTMGRDTALLIENGLIDSVSARIVDKTEYVGGRFVATEITEVGHIAFVQAGGVDTAKVIW